MVLLLFVDCCAWWIVRLPLEAFYSTTSPFLISAILVSCAEELRKKTQGWKGVNSREHVRDLFYFKRLKMGAIQSFNWMPLVKKSCDVHMRNFYPS